MIIGIIWFLIRSERTLGEIGLSPKAIAGQTELSKRLGHCITIRCHNNRRHNWIYAGWSALSTLVQSIIIWCVGIGGGLYLLTSIIIGTKGKEQWMRIGVIMILALFNIFFWVGFWSRQERHSTYLHRIIQIELYLDEGPTSCFNLSMLSSL